MDDSERQEIQALLAGSACFGALDLALRERLAAALQHMLVAPGQALLSQGVAGDGLFLIASGQFEVRLRLGDGNEEPIDTVGPGDTVGEMQLVVGGVASATVLALGPARVLLLQRPAFDALCQSAPELLESCVRVVRRRLQQRQLRAVLPSLLGPLDSDALAALEQQISWLTLRRGEVLFHQGDHGDAWYVVTSGRLAVVEPARHDQPERRLAEVARGEGVGEMALLTQEPRSATVYALRDCDLVRFPADHLAQLVASSPQVTYAILQTLARRLMERADGPRRRKASDVTVVLVPASAAVAVAAVAARLAAALARFGHTLLVGSAQLDQIGVARETANRPHSHPAWIRVETWLDEQSAAHRYVVLVADAAPNAWSARAVGRADQVIVVGDAQGDPDPGALEQALLPAAAAPHHSRRLLALLHRDGSRAPRGTARWLDARRVDAHLHIRLDRDDDIGRLARAVAGRSVALALSGGGARCFAHIGVVRALRERAIPIDLVTGTSAGALSAFLVAAEMSNAEMSRSALQFHLARPFSSYTLPLFSLLRGDRLSRALVQQCGDTEIEDLWLPFVAVSSNLTRRSVELHSRGLAWAALRASCSLPGIVEPQIRDGQILVDGGLIDNLPVGVARARLAERVIAVDVGSDQSLSFAGSAYPSPWKALLERFTRRRAHLSPPGLLDVLLHSMLLSSLAHAEQMRLNADLCLRPDLARYGMLETAQHVQIIEAGYRHAREHLAGFDAAA